MAAAPGGPFALEASAGVCVRQVEHGWCEASPYDDGGAEVLRTVFGERVMTRGVWAAVVRVVSGLDDREGGVFVGIAPDGCHPSRPLGDREAGVGWGKAMPYVFWNDSVASTSALPAYPFFHETHRVRAEQRHYTFDYSVAQVGELLVKWGFGHYQANFRNARVDGMKLLGFTNGMLENEVGMSDPVERADLLGKIQLFFKSEHAFKRGDVVRLVLDLEAAVPLLTLFRRQGDGGPWVQVGREIRFDGKPSSPPAGSGRWRFAVTLKSAYDRVFFWGSESAHQAVPRMPVAKTRETIKRRANAAGPGECAVQVRGGKELEEGSLADWRYVLGPGDGAFSAVQFATFYNIFAAVVVQVPLSGEPDVVLQTLLPPSLQSGDRYRIPAPGATRNVLALGPTGAAFVSDWKAPSSIELVMRDLAAAAADPSSRSSVGGGLAGGWVRGDGCTGVSRRRMGGGVKGRQVLGADEGIEWENIGARGHRRADVDMHPPVAGQWGFEVKKGVKASLSPGALRPGVAVIQALASCQEGGPCVTLHLTAAGLVVTFTASAEGGGGGGGGGQGGPARKSPQNEEQHE